MPREEGIDEIEVHVATLCIDDRDDRPLILIGKRTETRKIFPGLWECGGGQVRRNQTFRDAVKAQMRDEFGLEIDVLFSLDDYSIETDHKIIPGIRFVCRPRPGQTIHLNPAELTEFKWITVDEMLSFPMIPGLDSDIRRAFQALKTAKRGA